MGVIQKRSLKSKKKTFTKNEAKRFRAKSEER